MKSGGKPGTTILTWRTQGHDPRGLTQSSVTAGMSISTFAAPISVVEKEFH